MAIEGVIPNDKNKAIAAAKERSAFHGRPKLLIPVKEKDAFLPTNKGVLFLGVKDQGVLLRGEAVAAQGATEGVADGRKTTGKSKPTPSRRCMQMTLKG